MPSLSCFLNPVNLRGDVRAILKEMFGRYLTADMTLYDIGCGDKPFSDVLDGKIKSYVGVDMGEGFYDDDFNEYHASHVDLIGTAYDVPAEDQVADAVLSCQVLEHLERPVDALKETHRILKPGGYFFLALPYLFPIHAAPYDFGRYTSYFLENRLKEEGFEIIEQRNVGGYWYASGVFAEKYFRSFNRGILRKIKIVSLVIWLLKAWCRFMHNIEGFALKITGRDEQAFRNVWATNYIYVARKK